MDSEPSPTPPELPEKGAPPPPVPAAPAPLSPASSGPRKNSPALIVLGILLPFIWGAIAVGMVFMAMLMMAFMSDAGLKNKELQEGALLATLICIGVAGVAGIPLGVGIAAWKIRKPALIIGGILAIGGLVGAVVSFLIYFTAFMG